MRSYILNGDSRDPCFLPRSCENRGQPLVLRYWKDNSHTEQSDGLCPCIIPSWPLGPWPAGARLWAGSLGAVTALPTHEFG